jgi:hypothetical protein
MYGAFFMLIVIGIAQVAAVSSSNNFEAEKGWRPLAGLAIVLIWLIGGVWLLANLPTDSAMTRTGLTFGALISGSGVWLVYKGIIQLMKRERK